jgi:hypothetical protein
MNAVYIRQTPDWKNMTKEKFLAQSFNYPNLCNNYLEKYDPTKYWQKIIKNIWKFIEIWDEKCELSYFQYRQKLKEISLKNIESLNCKLIDDKKNLTLEDDLLFVSVDDDDWLAPSLFEKINEYKYADVIIWTHTVLNFDGSVKTFKEKRLFTNNYALTKKGIEKIQNIKETPKETCYPFATDAFFPHYDIHRRVFKNEFMNNECRFKDLIHDKFNIVLIEDQLSITNKSIASASELVDINKDIFFDRLNKLSKKSIENFLWASKEIKLLNFLNSQIKFKPSKHLYSGCENVMFF